MNYTAEKHTRVLSIFLNLFASFTFYLKEKSTLLLPVMGFVFLLSSILLCIYEKKRYFVLIVKTLALFLLLALWMHFYLSLYSDSEPYFPLKTERVTKITGTLTKDSVLTKSGGTLLTLRLNEAEDEDLKIRASARGVVNLLLPQKGEYVRGEKVSFTPTKKSFSPENEEKGLYFASKVDIIKERGVFSTLRLALLHDFKKNLQKVRPIFSSRKAYQGRLLSGILLFQDTPGEEFSLKTKSASLGLSHLFSLSGLHLGLIASFLSVLFSFFLPRRKVSYVILPFLGLYTALVGCTPSLVRAFLMRFVAVCFVPLRPFSLFFALLLQSVLFKESLLTLSFEFSFVATAAIVSFLPFFRFLLSSFFPSSVSVFLSLGVSALVFSSPLSLQNFGTWSLGGVLFSSFATLLIGANMIGGSLLIFFPHSYLGSFLTEVSYTILDRAVDVLSVLFRPHGVKGFYVLLSFLFALLIVKIIKYIIITKNLRKSQKCVIL